MPALAPIRWIIMHMAGAAMAAFITACDFGGLVVAIIRMVVIGSGCWSVCPRQDESLECGRRHPTRRDAVAQRLHRRLDLGAGCPHLIEGQLQTLAHDCHADIRHARQAADAILDLRRTGCAIHAGYGPFADLGGLLGFRRHFGLISSRHWTGLIRGCNVSSN